MSWGMIAVAAASVVGGAMSAGAAKDAASTQAGAASDATALQKYIFDTQMGMQQPFRDFGLSGTNKLAYLMGLSPNGYGGGSGGGGTGAPTVQTADQIRQRLVAQYTSNGTATPANPAAQPWENGGNLDNPAPVGGAPGPTTINEVELQKAIDAEMKKQQGALAAYNTQAEATAGQDPQYGSLLDTFGMDDFKADPGYRFRMQEGRKALERSASARGGLYSGRAGKDFMRFGQGLGSEEYSRSYDRFRLNQGDKFNRLASISGIGQTATNQTSAAAGQYGTSAGSNIIGAGNAQAAGRVGSANAWSGAIGQGVSAYQSNQLMNTLRPPSSTGYESWQTSGNGMPPGYTQ